jgi:hypothetical protein
MHQHQLPAVVDEVHAIRYWGDTHTQLGGHLKVWWLVCTHLQHHDTAEVNTVEAASKH